ncbi:hypothetical protein [Flavobacterium sp. SM2513]|uniref:hypothetical protein n=1 Tax=Flavobacterium sp. SM2513 TaxID=3424766 RepID=UPI003D7F8440
MLKNKKENIFWVFIVLFYLGYTYFIFTKPKIIESKNLIEIKGQLAEKPIFYESTGDNVPSVSFKIIENPAKYEITSCGFENLKREKFLSLKFRDSVIFTTKKTSNLYEKIMKEKEVYSIGSNNHLELLRLKDYNSCEKSVWKEFFLITILLLITAIFSFIHIRNTNQNIE